VTETRRDIYWSPAEEPGLEHLAIHFARRGGVKAEALLLRRMGDRSLRMRYRLETDESWHTRRLEFALEGGAGIILEADGAGHWLADGAAAPALDDCLDVDIQVTPFTNTLPIRRLALEQGATAEIDVVYLPVPELTPRSVAQRYTRLAADRFRYDGLFRDFSAELAVDADGLVIDYPQTFTRVWPR
jgi:hypothetical protein